MSEKNKSLADRIIKSSSIIIFFAFLASPLGYLIRMLISRVLSQEHFGLLFAVISLYTFLTTFNDLGYGQAISYFIPKFYSQKKYKTCWLLFKYDQIIEIVTSLSIILVLFLTKNFWVESFFKHKDSELLLYFFSVYLLANGVTSSLKKTFIGFQDEKYYASIEFVRMLSTFLITLFFFYLSSDSVFDYAYPFIFGYVITSVVYSFLFYRKYAWLKTKLVFKKQLLKKTAAYAVPTFFATSLFVIINSVDTLLLTFFQTVEEVGIYNIIFPIFSIIFIIFGSISSMLLPLISELHNEKDSEALQSIVTHILILFPYLNIAFSLFLYMFPEIIISTMFGEKWVSTSASLLQVMAIGYIPIGINRYLSSVVNGLGRVKEKVKISLITVLLSFILGSIGVYFDSIRGLIVANSIVFTVSFFLQFKLIQKDISIVIPIKKYAQLFLMICVGVILKNYIGYIDISLTLFAIIALFYCFFFFVVAVKLDFVNEHIIFLLQKNVKSVKSL